MVRVCGLKPWFSVVHAWFVVSRIVVGWLFGRHETERASFQVSLFGGFKMETKRQTTILGSPKTRHILGPCMVCGRLPTFSPLCGVSAQVSLGSGSGSQLALADGFLAVGLQSLVAPSHPVPLLFRSFSLV